MVVAAVGATVTACAEQGPQVRDAEDAVTTAGGAITQWPRAGRPARATFGGTTDTGEQLDSRDLGGRVAVLNFWYAGCPPCRAEASDLQALWQRNEPRGVRFVGVNVRDDLGQAKAFARQFQITYPSIMDRDGAVQLALIRTVSLKAVPTTLLLDRQGQPAARILGKLPSRGTLQTLIDDVLAET